MSTPNCCKDFALKSWLISIPAGILLCALLTVSAGTSDAAAAAAVPTRSQVAAPVRAAAPRAAIERIDVAAAKAEGVSPDVLQLALGAVACASGSGAIDAPPPTLTLIDYSRPSVEPRLWVFDLASGNLLFKELVAHGRNTGENFATHFSDQMNSRQSSLGLFVTDETYVGSNGYSLRLNGLEPGFNANARDRAIVMHGAPYVDETFAEAQGRLGRSWGCPALRPAIARQVIDRIRGGGVIFSYYPDAHWLQGSRFLKGCGA
jgi:hypothetical protein